MLQEPSAGLTPQNTCCKTRNKYLRAGSGKNYTDSEQWKRSEVAVMRVHLNVSLQVTSLSVILLISIGQCIPVEAEAVIKNDDAQAKRIGLKEEQKLSVGADLFDSLSSKLRYAYTALIESSTLTRLSSKTRRNSETDRNKYETTQLSPVILVPGYGGSRLEAKWNRVKVEHFLCESQSDWTNIWLDVKRLLPYMIDCLIELFRLEFDHKTNTTHNTHGVEVRVKDPDSLSTVEYLTNLHAPSFGYFAPIIKSLIDEFGYERDVNLRGAPYDFRKAPNELTDYFKNLKLMSELMYKETDGQQQVTYICHSMGCNNILYFLQHQPTSWKNKHVRRVISLAAPWAGSMAALRAAALGDNLGLTYLLSETTLNRAQRSLPSTVYLFPHQDVFADIPLVRSHVDGPAPKTYTTGSYMEFFDRLEHPDGYNMWLQTKDLLSNIVAPQVEVHCLYGENIKTIGRFEFKGDFPNSTSEVLYDDGDGTVTVQSSAYCKRWTDQQKQPIFAKGFHANHVDMLRHEEVLHYIGKTLAPEQDTLLVDNQI